MSSLLRKMASGAAWMVLFKFVDRFLGLVSTIILARLLIPEDFGIIAMAMSIVALIELFGAFSFDMALIQNQQATREHYDTAWTLNVLFGITAASLLALAAYPASLLYGDARLVPVVAVLALAPLGQGFENIGVVAFRKEMTFAKEFRFLLGKKLVTFFVTIPLAFAFRSYWALVVGIVAGRFLTVGLSYYLHPFRPRWSLARIRELFGFSAWLAVSNVVHFLRQRSADFVVGRIAGPNALGTFSLSFELSNLPTSELVPPINRALFPGYSQVAGDLEELKKTYLLVIAAVAIFVLPAGLGLSAVAAPAVELLLSDSWLSAIPIIQVLAIYGAISAMQGNNGLVYMAIGRPRMIVYLGAVYTTIQLGLLLTLVPETGALGAAHAYIATASLWLPIGYLIVGRTLSISVSQYLAALWRPVAASLAMYWLVRWVSHAMQAPAPYRSSWDIGLQLACSILAGATGYIAILLLLWWLAGRPQSVERVLLDRLVASRRRSD